MRQDKKRPLVIDVFSQKIRDFQEKYDGLCEALHQANQQNQVISQKIAAFEAHNSMERQHQIKFEARLDKLAAQIQVENGRLEGLNQKIDTLFGEIHTQEAADKREKRIQRAKKSNVTTPRSLSGTTSSFFGSTISSRNKLTSESGSLSDSQKPRKRGH